MPEGFLPLKEFDRDAWVTGITLLSRPRRRREGPTTPVRNKNGIKSPNSVNIGLGWWF